MPKVLPGQSLFDIALQEYGSIEAVFQLAEDNGISNITDSLTPGTELIIDGNMIINNNVVGFFMNNNIKPATSINEQLQGVGYWSVGFDFMIS